MVNIFESLRRFDAYPKTIEDARITTHTGALVTVCSLSLMTFLFWVETFNYFTPHITEELFVDTSRSPEMQINLDIVIPKISCDFVSMDALDVSGEQHFQVNHIYKQRLDENGTAIIEQQPKKEVISVTVEKKVVAPPNNNNSTKLECGSCYGAAHDPQRCCNTCQDVQDAYRERKWAFPRHADQIVQCRGSALSSQLRTAFQEGCQLYGTLVVNRVAGSFHLAPGRSYSINHMHVHDVQPFSSHDFNMSHTIRHLSFGAKLHQQHTFDPLRDTTEVATEGATMFQYYIKIVPTAYLHKNNTLIHSNQFSVTKHRKSVGTLSGESGMPGIFFEYELAPFMVKYVERARSFGHYITSLCAIIGGVFTVAGLIDTFLYHSVRIIRKKIELGKYH